MEWTYWAIVTMVICPWLQLCIHELSHLLVGIVKNGHKPLKIVPWPSYHEGRFYFARYEYIVGPREDPKGTIHIAPMWAGLLVCLLAAFAMLWVSPIVRTIIAPMAVVGLVDVLWFWRGYFWGTPLCDGKRWRYGDVE